ncbi:MAG: hypothetical protein R3E31_24570 [Chloroflexota bacterium]
MQYLHRWSQLPSNTWWDIGDVIRSSHSSFVLIRVENADLNLGSRCYHFRTDFLQSDYGHLPGCDGWSKSICDLPILQIEIQKNGAGELESADKYTKQSWKNG